MGTEPRAACAAGTCDALVRALSAFGEAGGAGEELPRSVRLLLARLALDELRSLVGVLRPDGTLLEANEAGLRGGGLDPGEVLGRPLWEARWFAASPETAPQLADAVRRAARGELVRCEVPAPAADAGTSVLPMALSLRPVRDAAGEVRFLVAEGRSIHRDGEPARPAEDAGGLAGELGRRRRELDTALDALRFARVQAERASAQKTRLVRLVSHELRTPLAALLLQVERLRRDAAQLSPYHRDAVARMRSATTRLAGLVESLLEYARLESGRVTLEPERLDPAAMAADVLDELRPQAERKGLSLHPPPLRATPALETDARLLRLVLLHLVANAVKFTDAGAVKISVEAAGGEHRIAVSDTGHGISREDQERIFEPFEQLETIARKHTPGIGLGLALARELVAVLGGRMSVESAPGAGSTFTVALPSVAAPAPPSWPPRPPAR